MKIKDLIAQVRASMATKLQERDTHRAAIQSVRTACANDNNRAPTDDEAAQVLAAQKAIRGIDTELDALQARITELEDEQARDDAADRLSREVHPGAPSPSGESRERRVEVREPRTYAQESDPKGVMFLRDVALSFMGGNPGANDRLARHMREEHVEREAAGRPLVDRTADQQQRAVGTGAFSGLVVPQYLTDLMAPHAKAGRPFADACRHHDLPEQGMTVYIGKVTTGTDTDIQSAEGDAVKEQDIDDTLLGVSVQTNAGQQTISRQAVERGAGVDDTTLEDLFRSHGTRLSKTLLNQVTNGLTNVATTITYTDGTPTAAELYPKLLQAPGAVEAAMLDQSVNDTFAVMNSRRWYWLQSQLTSTWPMFGQPGMATQNGGVNLGEVYGPGVRGILPSGAPVIVDNNVATNLGAGTNEDEIYFASKSECHLWEDPNAPMLIRAEQPKAANLQILLVVYSYFAYTFARRTHAQKIAGTGLVTPSF